MFSGFEALWDATKCCGGARGAKGPYVDDGRSTAASSPAVSLSLCDTVNVTPSSPQPQLAARRRSSISAVAKASMLAEMRRSRRDPGRGRRDADEAGGSWVEKEDGVYDVPLDPKYATCFDVKGLMGYSAKVRHRSHRAQPARPIPGAARVETTSRGDDAASSSSSESEASITESLNNFMVRQARANVSSATLRRSTSDFARPEAAYDEKRSDAEVLKEYHMDLVNEKWAARKARLHDKLEAGRKNVGDLSNPSKVWSKSNKHRSTRLTKDIDAYEAVMSDKMSAITGQHEVFEVRGDPSRVVIEGILQYERLREASGLCGGDSSSSSSSEDDDDDKMKTRKSSKMRQSVFTLADTDPWDPNTRRLSQVF